MRRAASNLSIRTSRRGFTLLELLVVIGLILVLLTLAVPSIGAMSYSANRALSENALRAGVSMARDVSIASGSGGDGVAVFLYEPGGRMRIVAGEVLGSFEAQLNQNQPPSALNRVRRDVIAPVAYTESVQLPRYWNVRGYAPPNSMLPPLGRDDVSWYDSVNYGGNNKSALQKQEGNWVFPESGFYDLSRHVNQGGASSGGFAGFGSASQTPRQTFMLRFSGRTGTVSQSDATALFVDPRPSEEGREQFATSRSAPTAWERVDWAEDIDTWTARTLGRFTGLPANQQDELYRLLGDASNDTVLCKSVTRLALYDERHLAQALGGSLNTRTGSIYEAYEQHRRIAFDEALFPNRNIEQIRVGINNWINGDTNNDLAGDGVIDENDEPDSRLFLLQGYSGDLTEVTR
ncbi:MAG: type II secretion system protein [Phycisphaerales bacterium]